MLTGYAGVTILGTQLSGSINYASSSLVEPEVQSITSTEWYFKTVLITSSRGRITNTLYNGTDGGKW
ncbi:hypothetical protein IAQ61_001122 [Plenodomus lingam]|uniref:uncharacterized protein n=1 Tax=Leptosphaeria maculans TaxID=5022 RepID=UPI0033296290|nr:hypothetical protein IAQ61_001122 [Plenodomus lingam]